MRARNQRTKRSSWLSRRRKVALVVFGAIALGLITTTEWGSYSSMGTGPIAALCPLGALEAMFGSRAVIVRPLLFLMVAVLVVVLFGKAFCAWVCPVPWLQRFLFGRLNTPMKERSDMAANCEGRACKMPCSSSQKACEGAPDPCGFCDGDAGQLFASSGPGGEIRSARQERRRRFVKRLDSRHVVLGGALASAAVFGFPVFCLICPIGLSVATLAGLVHLLQFNELNWGLVVAPLVLVLELALMRKWCLQFCPLSAVLSLASRANRAFLPVVDEGKCLRNSVGCQKCSAACPQGIDPHSRGFSECTKCGTCADVCPAEAIRIRVIPKKGRTRTRRAFPHRRGR